MRRYAAFVNGTPVSFVLSQLATGLSVEEVAARYGATAYPEERAFSPEHVRATLAYGAILAREESLPAPAAAGFVERLPPNISLEEVRAHAGTVLHQLAAGTTREEMFERHPSVSDDLMAAVLRYGASLARNDPLAAPPEPPSERFLRDLLSEPDRTLVEEFFLYWEETRGPGLPELHFSRWKRLVEELERDEEYADDLATYANELTGRNSLEEWLTVVSPSSKERWLELIMSLDKRFESATRHIARPVWGPKAKPRRWWWYRVPKRLKDASSDPWRLD
jgi:uncharacterized protein (DUF433 family)